MNIQEFKENYSADPNLRKIVAAKQEKELKKGASLVVFLADKLTQAGSEGLRELITSLEHSGIKQPLCEQSYLALPEETKQSIRAHHAAIVTGVTINSLEDMLVNRGFDIQDWCGRYNLAISGTSLSPAKVAKEFEEIPGEQLKLMYDCISSDKTFGMFFERYTTRMPEMMTSLLESSGALPYIGKTIMPFFKERAKYLITSSTGPES
ncbi:hypothetical protein HYW46_01555 [Candidatus Daviesbacteria bacterium]|nr:hypothetical protein [Candidatus Daviesbacteria bacterium]